TSLLPEAMPPVRPTMNLLMTLWLLRGDGHCTCCCTASGLRACLVLQAGKTHVAADHLIAPHKDQPTSNCQIRAERDGGGTVTAARVQPDRANDCPDQ